MTNLPPLPEPVHGYYASPMFTADQMHAYASAAMAQAGADVPEADFGKMAQAGAEPVNSAGETPTQHAHRWLTEMACRIAARHYPEAPQWRPLPDLLGVVTQLDNMTTGLVRATTAQPDIATKLRDPVVVHSAMLRGEIATPAIRDMLHVYGEAALARWDAAAPLPAREPLTTEQHIALREAHCIGAADAYFKARPSHDHEVSRLIFEHGFTRGFDSHDRLMLDDITATPADKEQGHV